MWNCPTDKSAAAGGQAAKKGSSNSMSSSSSSKVKNPSSEVADDLDMLGQPSFSAPNRSGKAKPYFFIKHCALPPFLIAPLFVTTKTDLIANNGL